MSDESIRYRAYFLQTISSIFIVINQFNIKYLTKYFPATLTLGIRGSFLFFFNYFFILYQNKEINLKKHNTYQIMIKRSLASTLTVMQLFIASSYIPIGVANTIFNTNPIVLIIIEGFYFHKIKFNRIHAALTVICFMGVLLILQPQFIFGESIIPPEQYPFYIIALGSPITATISVVLLHDLKDKADGEIVLQYNYFFQLSIGYFLFSLTSGGEPVQIESFLDLAILLLLIFFVVIGAYIAQYSRLKAVFLVKPSDVVPFSYSGIIASLAIDIFVYDSNFNTFSIVGILLTSIGLFTKFFVRNEK